MGLEGWDLCRGDGTLSMTGRAADWEGIRGEEGWERVGEGGGRGRGWGIRWLGSVCGEVDKAEKWLWRSGKLDRCVGGAWIWSVGGGGEKAGREADPCGGGGGTGDGAGTGVWTCSR